jgi:hypothetical protein
MTTTIKNGANSANASGNVDCDLERNELHQVLAGTTVAVKASPEDADSVKTWTDKVYDSFQTEQLAFEFLIKSISKESANNPNVGQLARLVTAVSVLRHRSRHQRYVAEPNIKPEELEKLWSIINQALISLPNVPVSRSSQGFLTVPLCSVIKDGDIEELLRFHVWLPDGRRGPPGADTHAHQPYAQSWVLAGSGRDYSYVAEPASDREDATHAKYEVVWTPLNGGDEAARKYATHLKLSSIRNTGVLVKLSEIATAVHARNDTYVVPAGVYHRSDVPPEGFHATFFYFDSSRGFIKDACALGPVDGSISTAARDVQGISAKSLVDAVNNVRAWEIAQETGQDFARNSRSEEAEHAFPQALAYCDLDGFPNADSRRTRILKELGRLGPRSNGVELTNGRSAAEG